MFLSHDQTNLYSSGITSLDFLNKQSFKRIVLQQGAETGVSSWKVICEVMRGLFFKMEDPKLCLCVEEATVERKIDDARKRKFWL